MRAEAAMALLMLVMVLPTSALLAAPIRAAVPIYVPANLPVTGTVCLPSALAAGLRAKLYVDNAFMDEGSANETGCYKVTIKPLTPGKHDLYAEIYKGSIKVAEISAEVIAIEGMIVLRPDPLATVERGETKGVSLFIENRSPVNMSNVRLEIEAPFPIYGERMTRVRNFVIRGSLGDLRVNETREIRLELAVPSGFRPGTYPIRVNMTYVVGESAYSAPMRVSVVVTGSTGSSIQNPHPTTPATSTGEVRREVRTKAVIGEETGVPVWAFLAMLIVGLVAVAYVLWMVSRRQ